MILHVTKKHFHPLETPLCGYNVAMLGMLGVKPRSLFLIPRQVNFFVSAAVVLLHKRPDGTLNCQTDYKPRREDLFSDVTMF